MSTTASDPAASDDVTVSLQSQPEVRRRRRLSQRLQQTLAITLILALAGAFLAWYATRIGTASRARPARTSAQPGELILPPLPAAAVAAALAPPAPQPPISQIPATTDEPAAAGDAKATPPAASLLPSLQPAAAGDLAGGPLAPRPAPPPYTAESSPVLYHFEGTSPSSVAQPGGAAAERGADAATGPTLARLLTAPTMAGASASRTGSQTLLLPKGATVPCTLETAIDSQLPGLVTCRTSVDVYSADGQLVLLDRGTALLGEARSDVRPAQSRVFVLWTEARTPSGVTVPLASPASDALGRSGVPGAVDTHFFARFGAAILISVIDTAVQAAMTRSGGTTVIYSPQATEAILTEILRNTLAIPPTITVAPGARLQVLVARDLDFSDVYRLRPAP
jgi:type IV secretion system protein VirB10